MAQSNGADGSSGSGGSGGSGGASRPLPPVSLTDVMQALSATEANVRWWEGNGTLPRAERDAEGRLMWDVKALQDWVKSDAGQKLVATLR